MKGNPVIQINSVYHTLHPKEKMIADVVLKDPAKIPYLSVVELANLADTSYSSIVRFCKLIGYSGYSEFKLEMARYSNHLSTGFHYEVNEVDKNSATLGKRMIQTNCHSLTQAMEYLDYNKLDEACDTLLHAKNVYLCGNANSGLIAANFQFNLKGIGIPTFLASDRISMKQDAITITSESVLLAITQSGYSKDTVEMARVASEKGCSVIVITTCNVSPIMEFTTIPIVIPRTSYSMLENMYTTEITIQAILNILFVMMDTKANPERRNQYEQFFRELVQESVTDLNKVKKEGGYYREV